jgi:hypothetical protein
MLNKFTIDPRLKRTRVQDEAGDTAASAVMQVLDMEVLLANRQLALDPPRGIWPGCIEITSPLPTEFVQKVEGLAHKSDNLTVEYAMTRDTRIDGVTWRLSFTIRGEGIMTRRQGARIREALVEFARTRRFYLGDPVFETNVTYVQVDVKAKVGIITEPK